ncbi:MAG: pilus assembly protein N-terminal domain-containing protein [Clostridia bacterium]|nr:pilus assembly protein N-terminal domain-containing protein [Clostridia bacterium]
MKSFTTQKMSWGKVILLALATAVLTAVLKLIPFFNNTSFQDIAINPECWILFAVFIIVNCKGWKEAAGKTFVFFLISQPLIYLIQVPFSRLGFGIFQYYKYWFIATLLTLPGAVIAYQVRRKDRLSVAVLSVAAAFLGYMSATYFLSVKASFPNHLLSLCFCIVLALFFAFALLENKYHRAVIIGVLIVSMAVSLIILKPVSSQTLQLGEGNWSYSLEDPSVADVVLKQDNSVSLTANRKGTTLLTFVNETGDKKEFYITVSNGSVYINTFE